MLQKCFLVDPYALDPSQLVSKIIWTSEWVQWGFLKMECVKAIFWTWHSMVNILYCWQISNKFLILYSFDTLKVITSTENGFEENKSISSHCCLVKSSREYFGITTELRVSEIFCRWSRILVRILVQDPSMIYFGPWLLLRNPDLACTQGCIAQNQECIVNCGGDVTCISQCGRAEQQCISGKI